MADLLRSRELACSRRSLRPLGCGDFVFTGTVLALQYSTPRLTPRLAFRLTMETTSHCRQNHKLYQCRLTANRSSLSDVARNGR